MNTNEDSVKPVMVWIHGGGFVTGDSNADGTSFVSRTDIIFVSICYRLSSHGFMALPELQEESEEDALVEQLATMACKISRRHYAIMKFGGDPEKITIAGESAGGFSVMYHLVAPASRGLFSREIMESDTTTYSCLWCSCVHGFVRL